MLMMADLLFYTGFAFLFTHELDAIHRHEWRIFPLLSNLKEDVAYHVFVILHVPLFVLFFWLMSHPSENVRYWFQVGIDAFLIIHLGLHYLFKSHKQYEFTSVFSRTVIILMALFGLLHISLLMVS